MYFKSPGGRQSSCTGEGEVLSSLHTFHKYFALEHCTKILHGSGRRGRRLQAASGVVLVGMRFNGSHLRGIALVTTFA